MVSLEVFTHLFQQYTSLSIIFMVLPGGLYAIIPTYISEISDDRVRGTLGSTVVFACNLGLFFAYVCGEYVDYLTIPWLMIPGTLVFIVCFIKVPDSPTFFAKRNLIDVSI